MRPLLTALLAATTIVGVAGCGADKDIAADKNPSGAATTSTEAKSSTEGKGATTTTGAAPAAGSTTATPSSPATSVPDEPPASVDPLPKAAFVRRANAVCQRLATTLRPILASAQTEDDLVTVIPKMARLYEAELRGLVAIGPPKSLASRYRAFTRTSGRQVAEISKTPTKAGVLAQLKRVSALSAKNSKFARRLGLFGCVNVT